jgi:glycosyltransferase involved in cell wall biosynthesis
LSFDDEMFIEHAFGTILGRSPDKTGMQHYLRVLRTRRNKMQILSDLLKSPESELHPQMQDVIDGVRKYRRARFWRLSNILHRNDVRSNMTDQDAAKSRRNGQVVHHETVGTDPSGFNMMLLEEVGRIQDSLMRLQHRLDELQGAPVTDILGHAGQRFHFNLSTSNHWRRHVVGIVRVERELAAYLAGFWNVDFVVWDPLSKSLKKLESYQVSRILSKEWCESANGLSSFDPARLTEAKVSEGDVYISVGLDWDHAPTDQVLEYLRQYTVKSIMACHDVVPIQFPEFLVRDTLVQEFRQHIVEMGHEADKVWVNSNASKRDLLRFWEDAKLERKLPEVFTVPLVSYLAPSELPHLNARDHATMLDVFRKGEYILYVSSFEPRKNHKIIFDIWRELWMERGEECPQFVHVGMAGWGSDDLSARIPRMPAYIGGKINWLQHVGDDLLAHLYHNCAFTVFPSLYEGWGLAATEALAFGKVCVVANNSSLTEATQELMPAYHPLDFLGWKGEIERLLDDLPYRQSLESEISLHYKHSTWNDFGKAFCDHLLAGK